MARAESYGRCLVTELPTARGLWYRVHPADGLDLDQGKARSRTIETPGIGQAGLSAFASPHHLFAYVCEMGWGGRTWLHGYDDGITPRRVVAFHGHEIGRGADDEPLVQPEADPGCCGQAVHGHMAWSTFVRKLNGTPKPRTRWSLEQALEKSRQRTSGKRSRPREATAAAPLLASAGFPSVPAGPAITPARSPRQAERLVPRRSRGR